MASRTKGAKASAGRVMIVETEGSTEGETEERSEQEISAEAVIDETTSANPRTPEATIYRKDSETGEERWVAKVASSIVSHEWLGKKFGGGDYRVQHRKPNATGKLVYGAQETYKIDPSVRPEAATIAGAVMNADGSVAGGGSRIDAIMEAGVMSLIQQMQNANTTQMELVRSIVSERGNKGPDLTSIMTALSPIIAAIIPVFTNRPDVMTQAREIAELAAKNQGAQGGLKDVLGAFRELMEVKDMLGGGAVDDRGPGERMLEAALPKFMELADRYAGQAVNGPPQVAPGRIMTPRPNALPAGNVQPKEGDDVSLSWTTFLMRKVPQWVKLAERGKNPSLYAELEIDNLPPAFMGPLREFMMRDDAVDVVLQNFPALKKYENWSREFFAEIESLILGDDGTDDDEEEYDDGDGEESGSEVSEIDDGNAGFGIAASGPVAHGGSGDERGATRPAPVARRERHDTDARTGGADGGGEAPDSRMAGSDVGKRSGKRTVHRGGNAASATDEHAPHPTGNGAAPTRSGSDQAED